MARIVALLSAGAVLIGLGVGAFVVLRDGEGDAFADCRDSQVAGGTAAIGGPFTLTGVAGAEVSTADAVTKPTLLYFGYTYCPDVCPTDLSRNAAAADILAERGVDVGQIFVTVDPARDTPEVVGDYAAAIHPDILGLSGTEDEIAEAAGAYKVYYARGAGDDEFYLVDHSTFTYLIAPGHPFLEFFRSDASPDEVADSVACFAARL